MKEFCDFYLEMIKSRIYGTNKSRKSSALWTAHQVLYSVLQMFSPFTCFITEEIYQLVDGSEKSIHLTKLENRGIRNKKSEKLGEIAKLVISDIRKWKQDNKIKLGEHVNSVKISRSQKGEIKAVSDVICRTARVGELKL